MQYVFPLNTIEDSRNLIWLNKIYDLSVDDSGAKQKDGPRSISTECHHIISYFLLENFTFRAHVSDNIVLVITKDIVFCIGIKWW